MIHPFTFVQVYNVLPVYDIVVVAKMAFKKQNAITLVGKKNYIITE